MSTRAPALALLMLCLASCQPSATEAADPAAEPSPASGRAARALSPPAALAPGLSPDAAVKASIDRFLAARSFHARMDMQSAQPMTVEMDFVAPDRYRMVMPQGTQVIVGDTMYMQVQGKTMKMPLPDGTLAQWRDPLQVQQSGADMQVTALGTERIEGRDTRKFHVRHGPPHNTEMTYWAGADDLPVQLQHSGGTGSAPYTMTIRYSRFDDPAISIDTPR